MNLTIILPCEFVIEVILTSITKGNFSNFCITFGQILIFFFMNKIFFLYFNFLRELNEFLILVKLF